MAVTRRRRIERVAAALAGIAARAQATEEQRHPHEDSTAALIDTGIMRMLVSKRFGGHELGLDPLSAVTRAVSSASLSTDWVMIAKAGGGDARAFDIQSRTSRSPINSRLRSSCLGTAPPMLANQSACCCNSVCQAATSTAVSGS